MKISRFLVIFSFLLFFGIFLRLYHIDFGLPYDLHADEPEIAEFALRYTYEIRDIVKTSQYYRLMPQSFVYGTFPIYLLTLANMAFSKFSNIMGFPVTRISIYIFLRGFLAVFGLFILPATLAIYHKLFSSKEENKEKDIGILLLAFLVLFNWKLVVHSHYVNVDLLLTCLLSAAYLFATFYHFQPNNKYLVLTAVFVGLAAGTKITALLSLPLFIYLILVKKDLYGVVAFLLIIFGTFIITNPFSWAFPNKFLVRVLELNTKENGLVFDSVDFGYFKYVFGFMYIVTPLVFLAFLYGAYVSLKNSFKKDTFPLHVFLIGHLVIYLLFFSFSNRRVDRWLLPVLPIILIYGSYGLYKFRSLVNRFVFFVVLFFVIGLYLYFPLLTLVQYQRHTPKSQAHLWAKQNLPPLTTKYVVTEKGLDPMNELDGAYVLHYPVYEVEGAQLSLPPDPFLFKYVILSSKPMQNFRRMEVKEKYPYYAQRWQNFENTVLTPQYFKLIKAFELPKPNLVELSDVYIYEQIDSAGANSVSPNNL